MPYVVDIEDVRARYPEYKVMAALSPSAQKAAFKVRNEEGELLCLKLIAPDYGTDRLQRELLALRQVSHPNIAKFREYTLSIESGMERHHIIEEFVDGSDLGEHLGIDKRWDLGIAVEFFSKLCDALDELRRHNLVHRDLKPSNVRVRDDGSPVLIDFGLARHLALPSLTQTQAGAQIGSPPYFSPEQFQGTKRDIDHRTDLFALGILIYEAVVGTHPYWQQGMTRDELCEKVCNSIDCFERAEFTSLPPKMQLLLQRLLAKQRIHRPLRASQVAKLLTTTRSES